MVFRVALLLLGLSMAGTQPLVQNPATPTTEYIRLGDQLIATIRHATSTDQTAPSVPTLSVSNITSSSATLTWTAATDTGGAGLAGYILYRAGVPVATVNATTTTFNDTTLQWNTSYTYTVVAFDNAQNYSSPSVPVTFSTPPDETGPTVPILSVSNVTASAAILSWSASTDTGGSGVAGYKLYRGAALIATVNAATTTFTDSTLQPHTIYTYTRSLRLTTRKTIRVRARPSHFLAEAV